MLDEKKWYKSIGLVSGLVTLGISALRLVGFNIPTDLEQATQDLILNTATVGTSVIAVYGRARATTILR